MDLVERIGETVARQSHRRKWLLQLSASAFGVMAAWSVEGVRPRSSLARHCAYQEGGCECQTPGYCREQDPAYCDGTKCAGGCAIETNEHGGTGCWCTKVCGPKKRRGYYRCCDCRCPGEGGEFVCSCRRFVRV